MPDDVIATEVFQRLQQATVKKPAELGELCQQYLTDARAAVLELRSAVTNKQTDKILDRAHYLKGSSSMLGAKGIVKHCVALERMVSARDFAEMERAVGETAAALDEVEVALGKLLSEPAPPAAGSAP